MQRLYRDSKNNGFYLLDDSIVWPEGPLELQDLRRRRLQVDPAAVAPHALTEAEARERAKAEMAAMKESVQKGVQQFRDLANTIRQRTDGVGDAIRAAAASLSERIPEATPEIPDELREALVEAGEAFKELMTAGDSPEDHARLDALARSIRDAGGPDWTADPAAIPSRIRESLSDPELLDKIRDLWASVRDGGGSSGKK